MVPTLALDAVASVFIVIDDRPSEGFVAISARASSARHDPDPTNNHDEVTIELVQAPSIQLFFSDPGVAEPGASLECEATLQNTSSFDATKVAFSFELPEDWVFDTSLSDELRCTEAGQTVSCAVDRIEGNSSPKYRFRLKAPDSRVGSWSRLRVELTSEQGVFNSQNTAYLQLAAYRYLPVTSVVDSGAGSLREAIEAANRECVASPPCKIMFEIPIVEGTSHHTIRPVTPLPLISRWIAVDGTTQRARYGDTNAEGPEIEINGSLLAEGDGLVFLGEFNVREIVVNGFPGNGIAAPAARSRKGRIQDCYVGTDATGKQAVPNRLRGIAISARGSENYGESIVIRDNVISGNGRSGVYIIGTSLVQLVGNRIGVAAGPELLPLGNGASGVYFGPKCTNGMIQRNIIAFNAHAGIATDQWAESQRIRSNRIFANGSLGIDQGLDLVTPNVVPNRRNLPNFPIITSAVYHADTATTVISGHLDQAVANSAIVELFASTQADASGFGEGELPLGIATVRSDLSFVFEYRRDLRGHFISATRGHTFYGIEDGFFTTSEFSAAYRVDGEAAGPIPPPAILPRGADLSLSASYPRIAVAAGSSFLLSVGVENLGPEAAELAVVELTAPEGASIVAASPPCLLVNERAVRCEIGMILPDVLKGIQLNVRAPLRDGLLRFEPRVSSSSEDPVPSNNRGEFDVEVRLAPSLQTRVESPGAVDPGGAATYRVSVTHRSGVDARDVAVTLPVPAGWSLMSGPEERWNCEMNVASVVCRTPLLTGGSTETFAYTLRASDSTWGIRTYTRTITTSALGVLHGSEDSVRYETYRTIAVTTTADDGDGSLRAALALAIRHSDYSGPRCRIVFEIPASEAHGGVFSIQPRTPLPSVKNSPSGFPGEILIDGRTQTRHTGDTNPDGPEVELNGSLQSDGDGIELVGLRGNSGVRGLVVNGFPRDGIAVSGQSLPYTERIIIADNYIGTDAGGRRAIPNGRWGVSIASGPIDVVSNVISGNTRSGIFAFSSTRLRILSNRIGRSAGVFQSPLPNGASGVYVGDVPHTLISANTIANNRDFGVAISLAARQTALRGNSIVANGGLGIDHGLDFVTRNDDPDRPSELAQYPLILSARWDESANATRVEGTVQGFVLGGFLELFSNHEADASGFGEAEELVGQLELPRSPSGETQAFSVLVPRDLRSKLLTATWTRVSYSDVTGYSGTSEISAAVKVE